MLDDGRYGSISEMATAEKIERGYLGKVLQLTLLPPATVEAIVDGRPSDGVTLPGLMERMPNDWWSSLLSLQFDGSGRDGPIVHLRLSRWRTEKADTDPPGDVGAYRTKSDSRQRALYLR